jgi:DNA-binding response OmpR family regulator
MVIRVLHIDDEGPIRLLSRVNLEAEGVAVVEAEDGPAGRDSPRRDDAGPRRLAGGGGAA